MSNNHCNIRLRRGTEASWASANELLLLGEPGFETDTGRLKIGDGTTLWNDLSYFGGGAIFDEESIQDLLGSSGFLVAGTGIGLDYNDGANTLTINNTKETFDAAVPWTANHTLADGTRYLAGDLVYESGRLYKANFDNESLPVSNTTYWTDVGPGYRLNIDGRDIPNIPYPTDEVALDTLEPDGFVNRTDSQISFDNSSREFSILPKSPATSYAIYNNGVKVVKNSTETITIPNTTALYFLHFDKSTNNLSYKTTGFDFNTDIPIALIYYNADDAKAVFFGEERHGVRMDNATHTYLHNVFGTQYINGLSISNYTTSGNGSSNSDATIAIGDGLIYDEDIDAAITNSATPSNPFEQVLFPIAAIPVYYKVGSNGAWTDTTANDYPVKTGTTIQYNLLSGGSWSASNSDNPTNNRYIAYWICATTQENEPIISIMGQRIDSSLEQATSNNAWGDLNLTGLPIVELRPLYRLIYDTKSTLANTPKGFLVDVLDIRSHIDTVTGLTQNDHGNLYGLADDDHYQYLHIDNARTVDAVHTFTNGISFGDSTTQTTAWNGSLPVVSLGTVTGSTAINAGLNNSIQILSLDGTATTLTKGSNWPSLSTTSIDVVLRITVSSATTITWTIVTDWFNQPPTGALAVGTHLFLLRGIGSTIVEGHYIGIKTN